MGLRATGDQSLPVRSLGKDRVSHIPEGKNGWRGGRSEGAQSRPQSIFEEQPNPTQALGVSVERRSLHEQRGCLAKATLPRRWVFR